MPAGGSIYERRTKRVVTCGRIVRLSTITNGCLRAHVKSGAMFALLRCPLLADNGIAYWLHAFQALQKS
jgi:hypothetical protein